MVMQDGLIGKPACIKMQHKQLLYGHFQCLCDLLCRFNADMPIESASGSERRGRYAALCCKLIPRELRLLYNSCDLIRFGKCTCSLDAVLAEIAVKHLQVAGLELDQLDLPDRGIDGFEHCLIPFVGFRGKLRRTVAFQPAFGIFTKTGVMVKARTPCNRSVI